MCSPLAAQAGKDGGVSYSVVRPTAFFKSVSGQLEVVAGGAPFVYFDLGADRAKYGNAASSATCNPISEPDLAMAIVDCVADRAKSSAGGDPIWNVGGPDAGLSMRDQGELLAKIVEKEPKLLAVPTARARRGRGVKAQALALPLLQVPIGLFDVIINGIQWLADLRAREGFGFIPEGVAQQLDDAAELGRIGKYYAVEDMLTTDDAEKYGATTLEEHYRKIAVEGQEYDPYTTLFASKKQREDYSADAASS